jgi:cytochrome c oxidase subunit 2
MDRTSWIQLLPEQASTFGWSMDLLFFALTAITAFFTIGIVAVIAYFFVVYREREKFVHPSEIEGSTLLETTWSIVPFIIVMVIFVGGSLIFYNQYRMPTEAMEIYVVGKQWMWKFQHQTGQREINELHVPVGRKIKFTMTTEDVLHDLFFPAFRTKADVVPGRYTYIWFEATKPGTYHIFCAEYCGLNHSGMIGTVYVMEQRDFDNWLGGNVSNQTPVEAGKDLFENKLGCASCHQQGSGGRGPNLNGVFGKPQKMMSGQTIVADEAYIRDSILNPQSNIVEGYQPIMPTFKGQVTEDQLVQLVAYIKSLGAGQGGTTSMTTTTSTSANNSASAANTSTSTGTSNRLTTGNPNAPTNRNVGNSNSNSNGEGR